MSRAVIFFKLDLFCKKPVLNELVRNKHEVRAWFVYQLRNHLGKIWEFRVIKSLIWRNVGIINSTTIIVANKKPTYPNTTNSELFFN